MRLLFGMEPARKPTFCKYAFAPQNSRPLITFVTMSKGAGLVAQ
jgi:hypothetical protein